MWYLVLKGSSICFQFCSPQESVECNTAYESHYKTPFKVAHADDPLAGDSSPSSLLSSQSNSPAASHVKSETTSSCGSPDPLPLSSAASTPLSVNQEVPEVCKHPISYFN